MVRLPGLEPGTSSLSVTRSNHLSYNRNGATIPKIWLSVNEKYWYDMRLNHAIS